MHEFKLLNPCATRTSSPMRTNHCSSALLERTPPKHQVYTFLYRTAHDSHAIKSVWESVHSNCCRRKSQNLGILVVESKVCCSIKPATLIVISYVFHGWHLIYHCLVTKVGYSIRHTRLLYTQLCYFAPKNTRTDIHKVWSDLTKAGSSLDIHHSFTSNLANKQRNKS